MITLIVVTALALYGSKVLWQEGMIFEKPKLLLDRIFGGWMISKPLYACPPCMSSIWGTVSWFTFRPAGWNIWAGWPLFCLAVCGVVWVILYQFPFDE